MKSIFLYLILSSFSLIYSQYDFAIIEDLDYSDVKINKDKGLDGLDEFYNACRNARVVYSGENHTYVVFNNLFSFEVLKELYTRHGFKHHIIELGPARAEVVNGYLAGDSMSELKLKVSTSYSHFEFYKKVKKWMESLPEGEGITFHGIDVERFNEIPILNIGDIVSNGKPTISDSLLAWKMAIDYKYNILVKSGLTYFNSENENYDGAYYVEKSWVNTLVRTSDSLRPAIENYLGKDASIKYFQNIGYLREYLTFKSYNGGPMEHNWRETNMFGRLETLLNDMPEAKFYGQFGRCHSMLNKQDQACGWFAFQSTMNRLNQFLGKDKVKSLGIFYGSKRTYFEDKRYEELYKTAPNNRMTLFDLNPGNKPTKLAEEYDFVLVNDLILSQTIKRDAEGEEEDDYEKPTVYSLSLEYWPFVQSNGLGDIWKLNGIDKDGNEPSFIGFNAGLKNKHGLFAEFGMVWSANSPKGDSANINLKYKAKSAHVSFGYYILDRTHVKFNLHLGGYYTHQQFIMTEKGLGVYDPNRVVRFTRQNYLTSVGASFYYYFSSNLFVGLSVDHLRPLINEGDIWKVNGGSQKIQIEKSISNFVSPLALQLKLGFSIY
jgi:hypothetical protein